MSEPPALGLYHGTAREILLKTISLTVSLMTVARLFKDRFFCLFSPFLFNFLPILSSAALATSTRYHSIVSVGESSSLDIVLAFRWSIKWIYFAFRWSIIGNSLAGRWSLFWPALISVDRSSETVWRGDDRSYDRHLFPLIDHRKNKPVCRS